MSVELPHFGQPFTLTRNGPLVVEQGSPEDVLACVTRVVSTVEGFREDQPSFGISEPVFQRVPLDLVPLEEAIIRWEPRAADFSTSEKAIAMKQSLREVGIEV